MSHFVKYNPSRVNPKDSSIIFVQFPSQMQQFFSSLSKTYIVIHQVVHQPNYEYIDPWMSYMQLYSGIQAIYSGASVDCDQLIFIIIISESIFLIIHFLCPLYIQRFFGSLSLRKLPFKRVASKLICDSRHAPLQFFNSS